MFKFIKCSIGSNLDWKEWPVREGIQMSVTCADDYAIHFPSGISMTKLKISLQSSCKNAPHIWFSDCPSLKL